MLALLKIEEHYAIVSGRLNNTLVTVTSGSSSQKIFYAFEIFLIYFALFEKVVRNGQKYDKFTS